MSTVPPASDAGKDHAENNHGDTNSLGDMLTGKTNGIRNIEAAFDRAGATKHHVPGHAGSLGSDDQGAGNDPGIRKEEVRCHAESIGVVKADVASSHPP